MTRYEFIYNQWTKKTFLAKSLIEAKRLEQKYRDDVNWTITRMTNPVFHPDPCEIHRIKNGESLRVV